MFSPLAIDTKDANTTSRPQPLELVQLGLSHRCSVEVSPEATINGSRGSDLIPASDTPDSNSHCSHIASWWWIMSGHRRLHNSVSIPVFLHLHFTFFFFDECVVFATKRGVKSKSEGVTWHSSSQHMDLFDNKWCSSETLKTSFSNQQQLCSQYKYYMIQLCGANAHLLEDGVKRAQCENANRWEEYERKRNKNYPLKERIMWWIHKHESTVPTGGGKCGLHIL